MVSGGVEMSVSAVNLEHYETRNIYITNSGSTVQSNISGSQISKVQNPPITNTSYNNSIILKLKRFLRLGEV